MQRSDFHYDLPAELIAQHPAPDRTASRLLQVDGAAGILADRVFAELPGLLTPGDLLVLNDTRVIPARLYGQKDTGGQVEVLVERLLDDQRLLAQVNASKSPKPGRRLYLAEALSAIVERRRGELFELRLETTRPLLEVLETFGHVPLPPYIERADSQTDQARYQTVFASQPGAVAAPTAGLHFDAALLTELAERGIEQAYLTLHVGAGTFMPVREQDLDRHVMHAEYCRVSAELCAAVAACKARGGCVVAVGTTCIRALETAALTGDLQPFAGETRLFIRPGFQFQVVDRLITNFHLPESSLLMLVAAFGGYPTIMRAYRHAVESRYRFFSYGDAMLVSLNNAPCGGM